MIVGVLGLGASSSELVVSFEAEGGGLFKTVSSRGGFSSFGNITFESLLGGLLAPETVLAGLSGDGLSGDGLRGGDKDSFDKLCIFYLFSLL